MSYALSLYRHYGILPSQAIANFKGDPPPGGSVPLITKETLDNAFKLPNEGAVAFLKSKGFKITWDSKSTSADMHARAFTVAKVTQADVLQSIYDELSSALNEGKTFEDFQKGLVPKLESAGWFGKKDVVDPVTGNVSRTEISSRSRLENIYRTNTQSAYMDARYDQMKEAFDAFPYVRINALVDDATTEICLDIDGKVFRMDDKGLRLPPLHYRCRTEFEPMDDAELEQLGIKPVSSTILSQAKHPIQESFDRPPGTPWEPDVSKYARPIQNVLTEALKVKA